MNRREDWLRRRLARLVEKTQDTPNYARGWWSDDVATRRQAVDDLKSGRRLQQDALEMAELGLRHLRQGEIQEAEAAAWAATDLYVGFLEARMARVKPRERPSLTPAKKRGAPRKK